jgi:hypothetical protein
MYKCILFLLLSCVSKFSIAQKVETVYLNPDDSTSNFYIIVYPPKLPWTGYMFLIQGMFQQAEDLFIQTELPIHAAQQGILTIIPVFRTGIASFGIDTATQASFLEILDHVTSHHQLLGQPFYAGGFSIGGTCALKYAELAYSLDYPIKPAAVFAIDSPLDFERVYNTIIREKRLLPEGKEPQPEGEYILKRLRGVFGGTPDEVIENYYRVSPYSFNDTSQQAIKALRNLPIRLYTEPDIGWWLRDGTDYAGMNAFDFAALTNELTRLGNTRVEMITTEHKGFRKPANERHPHSWSIAEPQDLVKWLRSHE